MDCNNLTQDEFKKHTFQFIHVLRQNGAYVNKYDVSDETELRRLASEGIKCDVGSPDNILKDFQDDARELIGILNDNKSLRYDMHPYFGVDKVVTFADIIDDWRLLFGILGIRFLHRQALMNERESAKVMTEYLKTVNTL